MRVLILEDSPHLGGVQHSTLNLVIGLKAARSTMEPILLLPGEGDFSVLCRSRGIHYLLYRKVPLASSSFSFMHDKLRVPNLPGLFNNYFLLRKQLTFLLPLVKDLRPDIFLTKGMGSHISGGRISRILKIPCVWHLQDLISDRYGGLYKRFFGYILSQLASACIADGYTIKDQLPSTLHDQCSVIFNGVDIDEFYVPNKRNELRNQLGIPEDAYVIGNFARILPWKGQDILLEAFIRYSTKNLNAHLILIGSPLFGKDSFYLKLKTIVAEKGLNNRVHFTGYLIDPGPTLSAMDLFVYPSVEKDTSPLALISAMSAGLPIAISDIAGLREMFDGIDGIEIFENRNIDGIVKLFFKMEDRELREYGGQQARLLAKERFSKERYVKEVTTVLERVGQITDVENIFGA
jgi:hypothetical protein